jgi:hypothetical protein
MLTLPDYAINASLSTSSFFMQQFLEQVFAQTLSEGFADLQQTELRMSNKMNRSTKIRGE